MIVHPLSNVSFGILQCYSDKHLLGRYKDFSIDIYKSDNARMVSVSKAGKWLGAKIICVINNVRHIFYKF